MKFEPPRLGEDGKVVAFTYSYDKCIGALVEFIIKDENMSFIMVGGEGFRALMKVLDESESDGEISDSSETKTSFDILVWREANNIRDSHVWQIIYHPYMYFPLPMNQHLAPKSVCLLHEEVL